MKTPVANPLIHELPFLDAAPTPTYQPPQSPSSLVPAGWRRQLLSARLAGAELKLLAHWPRYAGGVLHRAEQLRDAFYGPRRPQKIACVAGRYYREYHVPGWPGTAHSRYVAATIARLLPTPPPSAPLHTVYLAVTKKCPLSCDHCFEWDALNQPEKLSRADLHELVSRFQARHVTQIFFTGGEPLLRVPDLVAVLEQAQPDTDFWVITSGFHFTQANAQRLKAAGLTGVVVSLDHHEPARHNAFRGSAQAYENALRAVAHAHAAGLVVCLSLCVTREFTTEANLLAYAQLARQLGVAFIKVLEPRAVGHYAGHDVALRPAQTALLDVFYEKLTYDPAYHDWPIVYYYGYHQRRMGCAGAADWFLYVDTDGDLHACPFCQQKSGSALGPDLDEGIVRVRGAGCQAFAQVRYAFT
jgi:MoaA/NifB/PqqE/SkfB family radical SAM enzyme